MKIKFVDKLLNFVFKNKTASLVIPLILGAFAYAFTVASYLKCSLGFAPILRDLFVAIFWYFGIFLIILMFTKFKNCPDWYIDNFELLLLVATFISAVYQLVNYLIGKTASLSSACFVCIISFSAVSLAHNKRRKNDT